MREITGMDVTATAIPITSTSDVRFCLRPMNQPSGIDKGQAEHDEEGQDGAYRSRPGNLLALMLLEERLGFRAGEKHQQQQAQLVEQIKSGLFGRDVKLQLKDIGIESKLAEHKGTQQDSRPGFPPMTRGWRRRANR